MRIAHAPDASADEDRCDRREYWLSRPSGEVLVAVDCESQIGADNAGPAKIDARGGKLHLTYTEFQSSDGCEVYSATVDAARAQVEKEHRSIGTVVKDSCRPGKKVAADPNGDGSATHPLLVLHR